MRRFQLRRDEVLKHYLFEPAKSWLEHPKFIKRNLPLLSLATMAFGGLLYFKKSLRADTDDSFE